jgi:serine/threonine protein kinase
MNCFSFLFFFTEQLQGQCSKKSDIYSMGVILIELLSKCVTIMECFKKVENIKKGIPLSEIDEGCCSMIKRLLSPHTEQRPDIGALKNLVRIKLESSDEINRLKKVLCDKDNELQKKDQTIDELRNEILMLKKQLSVS